MVKKWILSSLIAANANLKPLESPSNTLTPDPLKSLRTPLRPLTPPLNFLKTPIESQYNANKTPEAPIIIACDSRYQGLSPRHDCFQGLPGKLKMFEGYIGGYWGLYGDYVGGYIGVLLGYVGIMENKMETTI